MISESLRKAVTDLPRIFQCYRSCFISKDNVLFHKIGDTDLHPDSSFQVITQDLIHEVWVNGQKFESVPCSYFGKIAFRRFCNWDGIASSKCLDSKEWSEKSLEEICMKYAFFRVTAYRGHNFRDGHTAIIARREPVGQAYFTILHSATNQFMPREEGLYTTKDLVDDLLLLKNQPKLPYTKTQLSRTMHGVVGVSGFNVFLEVPVRTEQESTSTE